MTPRFGAGAATRAISRELGISHSTVREYLARIAAAGITWPLPAEVTDQELEQRLFVNGGVRAGARHCAEPDWATVARELKRPGVNLMILWEEYRAVHADGYAYSRYCQSFREFERRLSPSMRQTHVAGDKAFVDFSGKRIPITDPATGTVREAEIFVAVLGASNLTYAEATWSQGLPDWTGAHVRMFRFWGARPRLLVPDNLKSGVHKASFYDPEINRAARGLDRTLFLKLADCDWIREHRHCLLTGPCGVGKSWLACALGFKACRENLSVLYQRVPRLFALLALGRGDGRYAKLMRQLGRVDLLILDDWGPEPLLPEQQRDLLEIVEDRYNAGSLIITSQLPVDRWYELVGNPTLADAILDRIVHNAYRVQLSGESLRKPRAST
jgi:transposase